MTDASNALQASWSVCENLTITLVRHGSVEAMLEDLGGDYSAYAKRIHGEDVTVDDIGGLTTGDEVDGKSEITIFIPHGHADEKYDQIISHEAVHAAFAVHRHQLNGKLDDSADLRVSMTGVDDSVNEESIAYWVGQLTENIRKALRDMNEHKSCLGGGE